MKKVIIVSIIVKKELRDILRDKSLLSSGLSILFFLALLNLTIFKHLPLSIDAFVFYIAPIIGVMLGFNLSNGFVREKRERIIETLLCTPINLPELWLGKVLGLSIPSWILTAISTISILILKKTVITSIIIVYILTVIPLAIISFIGLLGYLQYVLGMRQIQFLNYIVFFLIFTILFIIPKKLSTNNIISWNIIEYMLTILLITIGLTFYLVKHLNIEKLITTVG